MSFIAVMDKAGIPAHLLTVSRDDFEEETLAQVRYILSFIKERTVILVTGPQSPTKEKFIPFLMRQLFGYAVTDTMAYFSNVELTDNLPDVGGYAFVNSCVYQKRSVEKVRAFLFDRVHRRKIVILECPSKQRLEETYGSDFMSYIEYIEIEAEVRPDVSKSVKV